MVAAMPFIRDDSMDKPYVDHWNQASPSDRAKLLKDAGRDTFHKHKAWAYVPHDVKIDVVTIIKRNLATAEAVAAKPRSVPNPNHWYNKD